MRHRISRFQSLGRIPPLTLPRSSGSAVQALRRELHSRRVTALRTTELAQVRPWRVTDCCRAPVTRQLRPPGSASSTSKPRLRAGCCASRRRRRRAAHSTSRSMVTRGSGSVPARGAGQDLPVGCCLVLADGPQQGHPAAAETGRLQGLSRLRRRRGRGRRRGGSGSTGGQPCGGGRAASASRGAGQARGHPRAQPGGRGAAAAGTAPHQLHRAAGAGMAGMAGAGTAGG